MKCILRKKQSYGCDNSVMDVTCLKYTQNLFKKSTIKSSCHFCWRIKLLWILVLTLRKPSEIIVMIFKREHWLYPHGLNSRLEL